VSLWMKALNYLQRCNMNERIRELIRESHLDVYGFGKNRACWEATVSEFTEMIVKDCLSFCEYEGDRFDEYDSGMGERARIIRESIQKHFGVKE